MPEDEGIAAGMFVPGLPQSVSQRHQIWIEFIFLSWKEEKKNGRK